METTRRHAILGGLAALAAAHPAAGCSASEDARATSAGVTRLDVVGTIHSRHRTSADYSLAVLAAAIRKADPDVILTEIPPDRIERALSSFAETGEIDEPRTRVFPEYTDVIFPLSREMGFRILGTAGWTREIADNRRAALDLIRNNPARADQWAEHQAARRVYSRSVGRRGDDPHFIHSDAFDRLVEEAYGPYQRNFDADLGPGGWTQINRAHTGLIGAALDTMSGQGLRAMVTFGTAHKYLIRRSIEGRDDVALLDTRRLFE